MFRSKGLGTPHGPWLVVLDRNETFSLCSFRNIGEGGHASRARFGLGASLGHCRPIVGLARRALPLPFTVCEAEPPYAPYGLALELLSALQAYVPQLDLTRRLRFTAEFTLA